jgi:uncharacterized membrane protein YqjE
MENSDADSVESTPERATGLLASLQQLLKSFTEILHTRVELLSVETEEAAWLAGQLIIYALVAAFFLALGLLLLTVFIIKASPEAYQMYVLGGFGLLYLLLAVVFARLMIRKLRTRSRLFSATLFELEKDRKRLGTRS